MLSSRAACYMHPSYDVMSVRFNTAVVLSYGKSWDLLDSLPGLNQVYSHKAHRVHKGILWHPKVNRTCGVHGDVVGNRETVSSELWAQVQGSEIKLSPGGAPALSRAVPFDVKCSRSVKLFLHETQSIPPSSLQFSLVWSCHHSLKSFSLKSCCYPPPCTFLYHK